MRPSRPETALRGATAAGVATFAAVLGHAAGQQSLPPAWIVVTALALATPVCVVLAGRRMSTVRLAAAVVASQAGFHLLLRLDFGAAATLSGHHAAVVLGGAPVMASHDLDPAMWAGHALAAVATILVLGLGERAVHALAALARRPFRALAALAVSRPAPAPAIAPALDIRPSLVLRGGPRRRGPPLPV